MMATALYYPWIDIQDEDWLKTAVLYWDKVYTINPEHLEYPYETTSGRILQDYGILVPFNVSSQHEIVELASIDFIRYLEQDETIRLLLSSNKKRVNIYQSKFSSNALERIGARIGARIHPSKLSMELKYILRDVGRCNTSKDGYIDLNSGIANYYMTILANTISEHYGHAIITDEFRGVNLTHKIKFGASNIISSKYVERDFMDQECAPVNISDGILAHLTFKQIGIKGDVNIIKLVEFRENNKDLLKRFRIAINDIAKDVCTGREIKGIKALKNLLKNEYENKIKLETDELEKKLKEICRETYLTDLTVSGLSSILSWFSSLFDNQFSASSVVYSGACLSFTVNQYLCKLRQNRVQRNNPYTYLLQMKKELG